MFSSPAFGSFASPRFHTNGAGRAGECSSGSSESESGDNEGMGGSGFNSNRARETGMWQRSLDAFSLDDSREMIRDDDADNSTDSFGSPLQRQQHQRQRLLLRFSCADSLDRTSHPFCVRFA
jgi:hypothetical protein